MKKDDPDSWVGPIKPEEESDDRTNFRRGYRWQYRRIGGEEFMVDLLPGNPTVNAVAEQLLGKGRFVPIRRLRGIYCTLPYGNVPRKPFGCHVDAHPFFYACVAYIDDVPPDGGGFTVWPKSHRKFWHDFHSRHRPEYGPDYERDRADVSENWAYDQTYGQAGDVVFWHHRMGHMASHNYSRQIRKAVLCDYVLKDTAVIEEEPPDGDIWRDWNDDIRDVTTFT
jgi:hypothetical protein